MSGILSIAYENAEIGDVLQGDDGPDLPVDWHLCDGSELLSYEWPAFVERLGIKGGVFTLPKPERIAPGRRWIIKLGAKRPLPTRRA